MQLLFYSQPLIFSLILNIFIIRNLKFTEFFFQKRGEISVKGKGIMTTYWVFGKGVSLNQIVMPGPMQAGVPQAISPSMQRQISHHTSLAAVVYGMMQASKRTSNVNTTRKYSELCKSIFLY